MTAATELVACALDLAECAQSNDPECAADTECEDELAICKAFPPG
jgi:hypothetical protein